MRFYTKSLFAARRERARNRATMGKSGGFAEQVELTFCVSTEKTVVTFPGLALGVNYPDRLALRGLCRESIA